MVGKCYVFSNFAPCVDYFMSTVYELVVYLLNLWLVFLAKEPLDMVLNALALESVLRLDVDVVIPEYMGLVNGDDSDKKRKKREHIIDAYNGKFEENDKKIRRTSGS